MRSKTPRIKSIFRLLYVSLALSLATFALSTIYRGFASLKATPIMSALTATLSIAFITTARSQTPPSDTYGRFTLSQSHRFPKLRDLRIPGMVVTFTFALLWTAVGILDIFLIRKARQTIHSLIHDDVWTVVENRVGLQYDAGILALGYVPKPQPDLNLGLGEGLALSIDWYRRALVPFVWVTIAEVLLIFAHVGVLLAIGTTIAGLKKKGVRKGGDQVALLMRSHGARDPA